MKKLLMLVIAGGMFLPMMSEERCINWGVGAITEGQWNMSDGKVGWANRLQADFGVKLWNGGVFDVSGLATYGIGTPVVNDRQGFSNINAYNRAFRLIHAGLSQKFLGDKFTVFVGLKGADEDYFNTDLTGLFTGSSYGCFPTIGENHGIAVYPEAALGVHLEFDLENWTFRESLYNGAPSDCLNEQFCFRPGRDGLLNAGSVMYTNDLDEDFAPLSYTLGYVLSSKEVRGHTRASLWANVEQPLFPIGHSRISLLAQGAAELSKNAYCKGYWGAGVIAENITHNGGHLGLSVNRVFCVDGHETDVELTFYYPLKWGFSIQPALHAIRIDGQNIIAGQLRLCYEIGN